MENRTIDKMLISASIIVLILLAYLTLKALLIPIFLALILAYIFRPAYNSVKKIIKLRSLSALFIIIAIISFILIPLVSLTPALIKQTFSLYVKVQDLNIGNVLKNILPSTTTPEMATAINLQFNNILSKLFSSIMNGMSNFITNIPTQILNTMIFFFIFYFILIDFDKISQAFSDFIPLSKENKIKFSSEFRNVTEGIVYGQVLIGILQGILMGLMLFILGIDGTLLFTFIAIIAGILPMVGPTIVWVPLGLILLFTGNSMQAVILAVWGMSVSGVTDGILRPYILSRRTSLPIAWGFIGTIGGLYAFGLVGLLLGPLIIAYLIIVLQFYKQKKLSDLFKE